MGGVLWSKRRGVGIFSRSDKQDNFVRGDAAYQVPRATNTEVPRVEAYLRWL